MHGRPLAVEIYLRPGKTDMRKSFNTLASLVEIQMGRNPLDGSVFLFSNCSRLIKALYWDRTGFCMWTKRLEKNRWPWPRDESECRQISREQLDLLLRGIDAFAEHAELKYSRAT